MHKDTATLTYVKKYLRKHLRCSKMFVFILMLGFENMLIEQHTALLIFNILPLVGFVFDR